MIELACKPGVTPPILWIAAAITRLGVPMRRITITAGTNGAHKVKSKHYEMAALDIRTKDFPTMGAKLLLVQELRRELGVDYDVLLEGLGTANEHVHIEQDFHDKPKPTGVLA